MGITGLAILLTALIYEAQGNLDLFHGLCVFNLVSLLGFAIQPKSKSNSETRRHNLKAVLYYAGFLTFLAYSIHLFTTAPRFGSSPECNHNVVLVLLGVNFPATENILRWFIAILQIILAVAATWAFFKKPDFYGSVEDTNWPVAVEELAARAYLISNLELMIRNNHVAAASGDWSFGQIMSMILLVGPLVEFVSGLIQKKDKEHDPEAGLTVNASAKDESISKENVPRSSTAPEEKTQGMYSPAPSIRFWFSNLGVDG